MKPTPEAKKAAMGRTTATKLVASVAIVVLTVAGFAVIHRFAPLHEIASAAVMLCFAVALSVLVIPYLVGLGERSLSEKDGKESAKLELEHLYMRTLLENIPDNVYFKDRDSRFLMVSKTFTAKFGQGSYESILGKTDFDIFTEEHARPAFDGERHIIATGEPIINLTEKETKADGTVTWGLTTKIPVRDQTGKIIGTLGVTKDITHLKQTEMDLAKARDSAVEASRTKSEFLANMSHEIRTPMNGVIGMTGLLLDTELAPIQREFAETIRNSADSLLTIINDILDFSKIEAGKLAFEILDFDLVEMVEGAVDMFAERARNKGIELACDVPADVPKRLRGDAGRLRQVITNLIGNAIKFTEKGEVVLRLARENETDTHASISFSITDTGLGIPTEVQAKLFQAFTQADNSTTRRFGGTGLGLAISRQLVQMMDGEIGVRSEVGKGSTFWFRVRLEKQTGPVEPIPKIYFRDLFDLRVLVVDDNATNRQILRHQLFAWKMQKGSAADGFEALDLLRTAAADGRPYDLALLDMQMPEMDGMTLARAIKADPSIAATRLIILTSMGNIHTQVELKAAGVDAYLIKPVKQSRLFDCLISVLGSAAAGHVVADHAAEAPIVPLSSESVQIRSARILLAEDNIVNQKVALAQLKGLGFAADAVANGQEVLSALKQVPYDIILMDCQMPEMDGYEASRLIRQSEQRPSVSPKASVYIIAMTANAMSGDREKCLAAGMDDYLSKPVRKAELHSALVKWSLSRASK
jgi:two-component system sensor histidine kinase/response regulator